MPLHADARTPTLRQPASLRAPRLSALALAACATISLAAAPAVAQVQAAAGAQAGHAYNLPAAALGTALTAFGQQAGVALSFDPAITQGLHAPALHGSHTVPSALAALLAGTGLHAQQTSGGWVITRAAAGMAGNPASAATATDAADARQLPAVTVKDSAMQDALTEGTGSFTTRTMFSATGMGLSPRETPQSVSIVTRERMDAQGMENLSDAVATVTGVHSALIDGRGESYSSRGFGINTLLIDGAPISWQGGWQAGETRNNLAIYDRVEVVRGATGLLLGVGEPSAAINLVRKRAEATSPTVHAQLQLGSWKQRGGMLDVATGLNDAGSARARLVAQAGSRDTFNDREHFNNQVLYGVVEADFTADTRLSVGADWQRTKPRGMLWGGLMPWHTDGSRIDWPHGYSLAPTWSSWPSTQKGIFAKLEHSFNGDWKLVANAQRIDSDNEEILSRVMGVGIAGGGLLDRATGEGFLSSRARYEAQRRQQDFSMRLNGQFGAFGRRHELAAGLSFAHQHLNAMQTHGGALLPVGNVWAFDGTFAPPERRAQPLALIRETTRHKAGWVSTRLNVADGLKVIAGARLTNWELQGEATALDDPHLLRHRRKLTPYIGAMYDITPTLGAYASVTKIFNPQNRRDRHGNYLPPINGRNVEAGLKASWLNGALNASAAVFRTTQNNRAVADGTLTIPGTLDEQAWVARHGIVTRGYELELAGRVRPGLDVGLGWTHFTSKDSDGLRVNTNQAGRMLKLFSQWRLPARWDRLTLGASLYWQGNIYKEVTNPVLGTPERLQQPSYALLDLTAGWRFNRNLSAKLAVRNVQNKKYWANVGFFDRLTWGAPRSVALTVDCRF